MQVICANCANIKLAVFRCVLKKKTQPLRKTVAALYVVLVLIAGLQNSDLDTGDVIVTVIINKLVDDIDGDPFIGQMKMGISVFDPHNGVFNRGVGPLVVSADIFTAGNGPYFIGILSGSQAFNFVETFVKIGSEEFLTVTVKH